MKLASWSGCVVSLLMGGLVGELVAQAPTRPGSLRDQVSGWQLSGTSRNSGLLMECWELGTRACRGYASLRFSFRPLRPMPQPASLRILVQPQYGSGTWTQTECVIPPGGPARQVAAVAELVFPARGDPVRVRVFQGGREVLSTFLPMNGTGMPVLWLRGTGQSQSPLPQNAVFLTTCPVLRPVSFPQRWQQLSGYRVILAEVWALEELAQKFPRGALALRNWVLAGGTLLVLGDSAAQTELKRALQVLGFPTDPGRLGKRKVQWRFFVRKEEAQEASFALMDVMSRLHFMENPVPFWEQNPLPVARQGGGWVGVLSWLQWNPDKHGVPVLGRTALIQADSQEPDVVWCSRGQGMFGDGGAELEKIPGVGTPPVQVFLGAISMFVILVGPVNYFWLRRRGQLYRMLWITPLVALLVTAGLVVYSFSQEGFRVQAKAVSFTWTDGSRGDTITWAHQIMYTPLPPRELVFPADTLVMWYPLREQGGWFSWENQQRFQGGWIIPRQLVPLFTVRVRRQQPPLTLHKRSDGQLEVHNHLEVPLRWVIIKESSEKVWVVSHLSAGERKTLTPADPTPICLQMQQTIQRHLQGVVTGPLPAPRSISRQWPDVVYDSLGTLSEMLTQGARGLPAGTWVAASEHNLQVPFGVSVNQRDSLHIWAGRLK